MYGFDSSNYAVMEVREKMDSLELPLDVKRSVSLGAVSKIVVGTGPGEIRSIIGVWWFFLFTGTVFSFMAWIGVLVLIGVVVNNGIVSIDYINRLRGLRIPVNSSTDSPLPQPHCNRR